MKFYGELLIFLLLFITNIRVFFVSHVRRDPLVVLAPLVFALSILQIIACGIDAFTILGFILSFLVFISNFHAMFRYSERLYIDHYSIVMKCWAAITVILSIIAMTGLCIFAPVELKNTNLGVEETSTRYKGSFRAGFEPASIINTSNAVFYEFSPAAPLGQEKPDSKEIILFIPDKRGDTAHYRPYLQLLAKEGYTVCSADFYADDLKWLHSIGDTKVLRRLFCVFSSCTRNQQFMSQREFYAFNITQEYKALLDMMKDTYGYNTKFYLISDVMGNIAIKDIYKTNSNNLKGIFSIDSISEYKTAGYGCIEQTDPLLALYLGLKTDSSLATPKKLVEETIKFMETNNDSVAVE